MKKLNNLTHIYTVFAFISFLFLSSCGTEEDYGNQVLTISQSSQTVPVGSSISFSVTNNLDGDVSGEAVFFVNGEPIEGNTFTPTEVNAANEVYATYNGLTSNTLTFASTEVTPSAYTQKVLVEDYTGTWCIYCPGMALIMDYFTAYSDKVIPVAIHCGGGSGMNDPWVYEYYETMVNANNYNATGQPKGKINRIYDVNQFQFPIRCPNSNQAQYTAQLDSYLNQNAELGLAINSSLSGSSLNIQVKVGFATDNVPEARLVVYLIEEGLRHDQLNAYWNSTFPDCIFNQPPYNQNPIPAEHFEQKHVLLKSYTDVFGDIIPQNQIANGSVYTKDFNVSLPTNVGYPSGTVNPENLKIVAFVLGNGGEISNRPVLNVQQAKVNTNQDFD